MNRRRFLSLVIRVAAFVPFTRLAPRVLPDCLWGVDTVRFEKSRQLGMSRLVALQMYRAGQIDPWTLAHELGIPYFKERP